MSHGSIVVAVDGTMESVAAAQFAIRLGVATGMPSRLVHAVPEVRRYRIRPEGRARAADFNRAIQHEARGRLERALAGHVPPEAVRLLIVESGQPAAVLNRVATRLDAALIVLGGKRHSALDRWFGGSTIHNLVRSASKPVLVTANPSATIRRVLVAIDDSRAAEPTLQLARQYATIFQAELRVLSVFEPLSVLPEAAAPVDPARYDDLCRELLHHELMPQLEPFHGTLTMRDGLPVEAIRSEVSCWHADLLVVGAHGENWAQRMILGSVTEKLLNALPTSMLVAPVVVAERAAADPLLALEAIA